MKTSHSSISTEYLKLKEFVADLSKRVNQKLSDRKLDIVEKSDGTPVTSMDLFVNDELVTFLKTNFPAIPIISEELPIPSYEERRKWNRFFMIDPIDGTKELIRGTDEFTINIGLVENGVPVFGVLSAPKLNLIYFGENKCGAFRQDLQNQGEEEISVRPKQAGEGYDLILSRTHFTPKVDEYVKDLAIRSKLHVASSLKFVYLAEGKANLYARFATTMEWDTAAGDAILRAAGPSLDSPLTYNKSDLKNGAFIIKITAD